MCGIAGGFGDPVDAALPALAHRGPDASGVERQGPFWLAHARLAILDLDSRSDQPFARGRVLLAYNGELWNYRELREELRALGERFVTEGDTEVVAAALDRWGLSALPRLNGMFAFAWIEGNILRVARDRYGEVPLHASLHPRFTFASELKALRAAGAARGSCFWVEPGEFIEVDANGNARRGRFHTQALARSSDDRAHAATRVHDFVIAGAEERAISDVPACTLLSGGIDSAAVALALKEKIPDLVGYVAVMDPKSPDLKAARLVAEHVGIELREVRVDPPDAEDLADVVRAIEMPHKAQVEIAWACTALADRMRDDGFKVTFSGEGSDELWASYGFAYHALASGADWREYRRDLFVGQHRKNFARCNKVFMTRGIECRLPFLHPPLVDYALSLSREAVQSGAKLKAVMQDAFDGPLPSKIARRAKLAFQDGLGLKEEAAKASSDPQAYYRALMKSVIGEAP